MPEEVRQLCRLADIHSKSLLLQIVRQSEPRKMVALIERLQQEGPTRAAARRLARADKTAAPKGRPRHYVFRYQPKEKTFQLALRFGKTQVPRAEVVRALQAVIEDLVREDV